VSGGGDPNARLAWRLVAVVGRASAV